MYKVKNMKTIITAQSPRLRMQDYKRYVGIYAPTVHHKINVRNNILMRGTPVSDIMFVK